MLLTIVDRVDMIGGDRDNDFCRSDGQRTRDICNVIVIVCGAVNDRVLWHGAAGADLCLAAFPRDAADAVSCRQTFHVQHRAADAFTLQRCPVIGLFEALRCDDQVFAVVNVQLDCTGGGRLVRQLAPHIRTVLLDMVQGISVQIRFDLVGAAESGAEGVFALQRITVHVQIVDVEGGRPVRRVLKSDQVGS